jgi:hypothetical protein
MSGYISVDKKRTICSKDIIAILANKGGAEKSKVIAKEGGYCCKTSSRKLAERLESGKENKKVSRKKSRT